MRQSHTAHRTVETVHLITIEVVFIRGERCSDFLAGHRICHSAPLPSMLSTISIFLNQKDNRFLHGPVILYQLHYLLFLSGTRTNSTVHPKMSSTTAGRMTFSENMSELDRKPPLVPSSAAISSEVSSSEASSSAASFSSESATPSPGTFSASVTSNDSSGASSELYLPTFSLTSTIVMSVSLIFSPDSFSGSCTSVDAT